MKLLMTAMVVLLMAGIASAADPAKKDTKGKGKGVKGQIASVSEDGTKLTVNTGNKNNPTTVDVTCDDKTTVSIDGTSGKKVSDLKAGYYVMVSPDTGTATSITATTTKPEKKAKKPT